MRYSPRELKTLAEHYGKAMVGTDHSGDVDACEADRHHESVIIKCKCDD